MPENSVGRVNIEWIGPNPNPEAPEGHEAARKGALKLFAERAHNRPLNLGVAKRYSRMMESGEWELSNDALSINGDGKLDNAQHRMWAIGESKTTQPFIVLYHDSPTAFAVMDAGKKRTLAQILQIDGIPQASIMASAASRIYTYRRIQHFKTEGYRNVTEQAARQWVLAHKEDMEVAASHADRANRSIKLAKSVGCALAYLFGMVSVEDRDAFFNGLADAALVEGYPANHPIRNLRRRVLANAEARPAQKVNEVHVAAWTVKSWNAFRNGETIEQLKWNPGGARPEEFPRIEGLDLDAIWDTQPVALAA